jgi:hypothetical protein
MRDLKIIVALFSIGLIMGCTKDYPMNICDVKIHPVNRDSTICKSHFEGYYYSGFIKEQLSFEMTFIENDSGEWGDFYRNTYYWTNAVLDSSIELSFNKKIEVGNSIIDPQLNIIQYFDIQKHENTDRCELVYLLTANNQNQIVLKDTFYTIHVRVKTNDNQDLEDSCIVKYVRK